MLGQLHLCTLYKIFVINHLKLNLTLNFSKKLKSVSHTCTHISFHLKHQDQHFSVLLQSCAAKRIRAFEATWARALLPKHHPANQWVYWTFLSISPRWFWLWIHPCNTFLSHCEGPCSKLAEVARTKCLKWNPPVRDGTEPARGKILAKQSYSSMRIKREQTATTYSTASVSGLKTATNLWKLPKLTQSPLCCLMFTLWSKHCQLWISYKQGAEVKHSLVLTTWPHIKFLFCLVCCIQKDYTAVKKTQRYNSSSYKQN